MLLLGLVQDLLKFLVRLGDELNRIPAFHRPIFPFRHGPLDSIVKSASDGWSTQMRHQDSRSERQTAASNVAFRFGQGSRWQTWQV